MRFLRLLTVTALAAGLVAVAPGVRAAAHEPTDPSQESWHVHERLLVSDSATGDIVVVDDGRVRDRLSTPAAPISLARSADGTLAFAFRGRATETQHVSVIDTGYDTADGHAHLPYVARTWVARSAGGVTDGRLPEAAGRIGVALEGEGRLQWLDPAGLSGLGDADAGQLDLGKPGHYSLVVATRAGGSPVLHVGNIRGTSQVLDATSGEVLSTATGTCPALHGALLSADGERVLYACANGLRVVPADPASGDQSFVPNPSGVRSAALRHGRGSIVWGNTEGAQKVLQRIDTTAAVPTLTEVAVGRRNHPRTVLAVDAAADGSRLYVLTHQGYLQVRDGGTGRLLRERRVMKRVSTTLDETTAVATLPDLAIGDENVYVSVPHQQRIVRVDTDLEGGSYILKLGGGPTRMVLLSHHD